MAKSYAFWNQILSEYTIRNAGEYRWVNEIVSIGSTPCIFDTPAEAKRAYEWLKSHLGVEVAGGGASAASLTDAKKPDRESDGGNDLTVDDLAPRKTQEFAFANEYWFAGAHWTGSCSWDADFTDNFRNIIGLAASTRAEARAIADALAVIQEIKERSTCPPTVERCVAIDITDEEGHGLWSVSFGRFANDIEADAVEAHIGEARLRNAANWVRGLPLLIENYEDEE